MWRRVRKFFALRRAERRVLVAALALLPLMALALRLLGLKRCYAGLKRLTPAGQADKPAPDDAHQQAMRTAQLVHLAALHGVFTGSCLSQSLTLWRLLRRQGIEGELRIGAHKDAGTLKAHAWVEHQGRALSDDRRIGERFPPFDRAHDVLEQNGARRHTATPTTQSENLLCACLRDGPEAWPESAGAEFHGQLRQTAAYHGVQTLLYHRLRTSPVWKDWPTDIREYLQGEAKDAVALELIRKRELERVLDALAGSGIRALLLKGTPLAYSHYASPALRPRGDTDMLIRDSDREATAKILRGLGYQRENAVSGALVSHQCTYTRRERYGVTHDLDVHWQISNVQIFSRALTYEELISRSVPIAALGEHARAPAPADALLLACMHRVAHIHSPIYVEGTPHFGGNRLIWLYDIHLLIHRMSPGELEDYARLATDKGMRAICRDALANTQRCLGTRVPEEILLSMARAGATEPSETQLRAGGMRHLLTELRSLPRWQDRITLLAEHLFPPADYMLEKYAVSNRAWLPMLYLQRGIYGAWKRIYNP